MGKQTKTGGWLPPVCVRDAGRCRRLRDGRGQDAADHEQAEKAEDEQEANQDETHVSLLSGAVGIWASGLFKGLATGMQPFSKWG